MIFAQMKGANLTSPQDNDQVAEEISPPFFDAAWNLCRLGVLRPGRQTTQEILARADHYGYSLTEFGRQWLTEHEKPVYIPTDLGRLSSLLGRRADLFGQVYVARANDAARCFSAHACYACCAMIGAAAESILIAAAVAKFGESQALCLYQGNQGRKKVTEELLKNQQNWLEKEFRLHADLIGLWRDVSRGIHKHAWAY